MLLSDASHPASAVLPLQQHDLFGRAERFLGRHTQAFTLRSDKGRAGHVLLRDRAPRFLPSLGRVSRGPIWTGQASFADRTAVIRQLNGLGVKFVEPESPADSPALAEAGFLRIARPTELAVLDIDGTADQLRARLSDGWEKALHKARSFDYTPRHRQFDRQRDDWLLQKGVIERSAKPLLRAMSVAEPTAVRLFSLEVGERTCAAFIAILHGPVATALLGWAHPDHMGTGAPQTVLWYAINRLSEQSFQRLDFFGIYDRRQPHLHHFFTGCGARIHTTGGTWFKPSSLRW